MERDGYTADSIKVLEGLEGVRRRPAMYIGDTSRGGLHHLIFEVVDNSVDEAMAGYCTEIVVRLREDGSVVVSDNGRGIPVDIHKETGLPALEVVMTRLHAGGKFDHKAYRVSGGLHGVGVSVVNAVSEWLEAEVYTGKDAWFQRYERGKPVTKVLRRGRSRRRGTKIVFKPDPQIFEETTFSFDLVARRMREIAFLNPQLTITVVQDDPPKKEVYHYAGGLVDFVKYLNTGKQVLHKDVIHISGVQRDMRVELALQYHDGFTETIDSFVNTINTTEGGTHVSGLRAGLTRTLNRYMRKEGMLKKEKSLSGEDFREGLTAVLAVWMPDPQFESQTKIKLGNRDIQGFVESVVSEKLMEYLEEHPSTAKVIAQKALMTARAREAAKKARELVTRKEALFSGNLPAKLADCSSRDREATELFLVEGESAGGTAKMGRDRRFQAILPLRGKILNVEKARLDRVLAHDEIRTIIQALGTGIGREDFDISRLRYSKIILMTDADVDGSHIRTLLLTFFYRHLIDLVKNGHVFIAQPPLYRIKRGKKEAYLHSDEEMKKMLVSFGADEVTVKRLSDDSVYSGRRLNRILNIIAELERFERPLRRLGLTLRDYIANWDAQRKRIPKYWARIKGREPLLLYDAEELDAIRDEIAQQLGRDVEVASLDDVTPDAELDMVYQEIHESSEIAARLIDLAKESVDSAEIFPDMEQTERFEVASKKETRRVCAFMDVFEFVREVGTRGVDIQRYKGLGEMNAGQLWETTMNPETRTLLRVRVEDAAEADRIFTILMGPGVEARREFLERYALDVRRLDI